ncbi:hypothetical protein AFK49_008920 [Corynebacterium ulcerans]|nr:DUF3558 domain-containing protein [Corynebacterium ulcerans]OAG70352.1 hypothetical protein AFK49_008920 [Corynebacterium ulcerans]
MGIGGFLMHWLNLGTDSQQSYSLMRRSLLLLTFMIICALMFTACARNTVKESVAALHTNPTTPTTENAHPDFPEVMEPNPADPNFSFFDPCTDVPVETYERAGIRPTEYRTSGRAGLNRSHCHFDLLKTNMVVATVMLGSDVQARTEETLGKAIVPVDRAPSVPEGVYFVSWEESDKSYGCEAVYSTIRGRIWVEHRFVSDSSFYVGIGCSTAWNVLKEIARGI